MKKLHLFFALLVTLSLVLGACASPTPAPEPTSVPTKPVATAVPPTATAVPMLDVDALLIGFWAQVPAEKGYGTVAAAKLNEELAEKDIFLLDVREAAELEKDGYIEGAVNLPVRTVLQNLDKLPAPSEPIVIYCASGHRGALVMMALRMLGYQDVRNLGGGTGAWKKANLALATGKPADPAVLAETMIADQLLFDTLNNFLSNLPEGYYTVKADGLNAMLAEKKPTLVDVRSAQEVTKDGYIEGSINIPFADFLTSLDKLPADKTAPVVIYCASGHRGALALLALRMMGYTDVSNLAGGLSAWKAAKMPVAGWADMPALYAEFLTNLPADQGYYTIKSDVLNTLLAEKAPFILDVREAAEVEQTGYITGSVNIPVREVLKNLDKLPAQDQKIVVTCASGHRGAFITMALRLLGYQDVVNLAGGVGGWVKAQLPTEPGAPAAAVASGVTPTLDQARLAAMDTYLAALPEGFMTVKSADLNAELGSDKKPVVVDVRTADEFANDGHIEGAINISVNELAARLAELPADKAASIVILCKSGHRGALALMYLQSLGYTNVRNLGGGMSAWVGAELPVVK